MIAKRSLFEAMTTQLDWRKMELVTQMTPLLGKGIEYLAVINKNGRIEDTFYKNDINLTEEKKEMFTLGLQLQNSMQADFDEELGPVNYTITERENSKFISIPIPSGILLVKLEKSTDTFVFINKISGILNNSKRVSETSKRAYQY